MRTRVMRDYEVSVWSLQDSFLAVLKPYGVDIKGQIQNPKLVLKDDGTQEFSFSIPEKYFLDGQKINNPLWENTTNGILVQDMHKLKVIINKRQPNEAVFEMLIIKVADKHEKDQVSCEVNCEGLAFHELGKIGYKLTLSPDDFENDLKEYYEGTVIKDDDGNPLYIQGTDGNKYPLDIPEETLQYWNNKIFKNNLSWTYEIRMNYAMRAGLGYEADKVYEDDYVSSWEYNDSSDMVVAREYAGPREKWRPVDLKESNIYNITQDLAKAFEVFCRYEYEHDNNYHITGRKVIYYNNFIVEGEGLLDITYPYTLGSITRTKDASDLVTKLFVTTSENDDNWDTIMESSANKMQEDYILNFDYLKERGSLSDVQEAAIGQYETEMFKLNSIIIPAQNEKVALENQLPEVEASIKVIENSLPSYDERILDADALLNQITNNTGELEVTVNNPAIGIVIDTTGEGTSNYVKISEKGVQINSLHVYSSFDTGARVLSDECSFTPIYDDCGGLIQIKNLKLIDHPERGLLEQYRVYMTYTYNPNLYYKIVKQVWQNRKARDLAKQAELLARQQATNERLAELKELIAIKMDEKRLAQARFERLMGPALREGYWSPDDYKDYGDHYSMTFTPLESSIAYKETNNTTGLIEPINYLDDTGLADIGSKFIFDREQINTGEQKNYLDNFGDPDHPLYYPCLRITKRSTLWNYVQKYYNDFSVVYYDVTDANPDHKTDEYLMAYHINASCQYAFIEIDGKPELVVMVTDPIDSSLPGRTYAALTGQLYPNPDQSGKYLDEFNNAEVKLGVLDLIEKTWTSDEKINIQRSDWYLWPQKNSTDELYMLYPRLQVNSIKLKASDDEIHIKYNDEALHEGEDFTILQRDSSYYITFLPIVFARNGFVTGEFNFTIANANTVIYLDAMKVAKENAYPKVEYDAKINNVNKEFIDNVYNTLGRIANINDAELKFRNVQGYISELDLSLDKPSEDSIKVKNYKTKFEDLFSTIVAQTAQMQKNGPTFTAIANGFDSDGTIIQSVMQNTVKKVDLDLAFANGELEITKDNGIWATSDSGVVAIRGGGIFTSTSPKNPEKTDWNWNTGITPEGINADLITSGQLDTNLIQIYAGNNVKFQLNAQGLFAYKTINGESFQKIVSSKDEDSFTTFSKSEINDLKDNGYIDTKQYVVHNEHGLFLRAEAGACIDGLKLKANNDNKYIDRVAIDWSGFTLRNYKNERVFYADADTGDLVMTGTIYAKAGVFEGEVRASSLYIGNDDTHNYIDSSGHLLPSVFGDDIKNNIMKTALLEVDSTNGQILLSSLKFDSLGATTSGIHITPEQIIIHSQQNGETKSAVEINPNGITLGTGTLQVTTSNFSLISSDGESINLEDVGEISDEEVWNKVKSATEQTSLQLTDNRINLTGGTINLTGGAIDLTTYQHEEETTIYKREKFTLDENGLILWYSSAASNTEEAYNNEENTIAKITLNESGINVNGMITINDEKLWSQQDIILLKPGQTEQEVIDQQNAAGIHGWVLIQPQTTAFLKFIADISSSVTLTSSNNVDLTWSDGDRYLRENLLYTYNIILKFTHTSGAAGGGGRLNIALGNKKNSHLTNFVQTQYFTTQTGLNTASFSDTVLISSSKNIFTQDAQPYIRINGGSSPHLSLVSAIVTCKVDGEQATSGKKYACTLYYYA